MKLMTKNIKGTILALTMAAGLAGSVTPAFAATAYQDSVGSAATDITAEVKTGVDTNQSKTSEYQDITEDSTEAANVYATLKSEFTATIPKTIILDGETKAGAYAVAVAGDIAGDETITVAPDASFLMSQEGKADITASITQDKTAWTYDEFGTNAAGSITAEDLSAGSWDGSFNFTIGLDKTVADAGETTPDTTP